MNYLQTMMSITGYTVRNIPTYIVFTQLKLDEPLHVCEVITIKFFS